MQGNNRKRNEKKNLTMHGYNVFRNTLLESEFRFILNNKLIIK